MSTRGCIVCMVAGVGIALSALWGGSYLLSLWPPHDDWKSFPAFITSMAVGFGGVAVFIGGAARAAQGEKGGL